MTTIQSKRWSSRAKKQLLNLVQEKAYRICQKGWIVKISHFQKQASCIYTRVKVRAVESQLGPQSILEDWAPRIWVRGESWRCCHDTSGIQIDIGCRGGFPVIKNLYWLEFLWAASSHRLWTFYPYTLLLTLLVKIDQQLWL